MQRLLQELADAPAHNQLVLMPVSRLLVHEPFTVGPFHFYPAAALDLFALRPIANKTFESQLSVDGITTLRGHRLREVSTSLTGFSLDAMESSALIAFVAPLNWNKFLSATHNDDINTVQDFSSRAGRALDVIRFEFCSLDLPNALPGLAGSWEKSGEYLGAMIYTAETNESYLIAGAGVEGAVVVKGIGLEIDVAPSTPLPDANDGGVAAVALHGLSLLSDAMNATNETVKFVRSMTLLEFLASPDEYNTWKKIKGDIACHCARDRADYLRCLERFKELTSVDEGGVQRGLRTLVVHHGKFLSELIPEGRARSALFRELQRYCRKMLADMIENRRMSWDAYCLRRAELKRRLGVQ